VVEELAAVSVSMIEMVVLVSASLLLNGESRRLVQPLGKWPKPVGRAAEKTLGGAIGSIRYRSGVDEASRRLQILLCDRIGGPIG
jgi:hypothetical protein